MRVLVTGASGFAGGHLARICSASGDEVTGLSRRGLTPAGSGVACDLLDPRAAAQAVSDADPQVVFHLAALASTGHSWEDPIRCVGDNQATTWNLMEAIRTTAPDAAVVIVGSGESYGAPQHLPVGEGHALAPATPYAIAKTVTDLIGGLYADAHGMRVIRVRAFNMIGPGQGPRFLLGSLCRQAAEQIDSGTDPIVLRTGDSSVRRDYTDVRDVADAMRLLATEAAPGVYNVCSGRALSTGEMANAVIEALAPREAVHQVDPDLVRPHETADIHGDPGRTAAATGWAPSIPLTQTIADSLTAAGIG